MRRLAILTLLSALFARSEVLPIRVYTSADGLAANKVTCVVRDSRGFLWFCTPEGLSRFDGVRFVNFGAEDGLPHSRINTLIETSTGDRWIGTPRGLSRISASGRGSRFTNYRLAPEAPPNNVDILVETHSGKFWGSTQAGLFEWTDVLHPRASSFPRPPQVAITALALGANDDLWVGTTDGLDLFREDSIVQRITASDGMPGHWINQLLRDSHGRIWAGLRTGLALITSGPTGGWRVEKTYTPTSGLVGWDVTALAEASDGSLWVGTLTGISHLTGTGELEAIQNITRAQGLSDRTVYALGEDQAGNMWAGTQGGGVVRIAGLGFTTYREPDGLPRDEVLSVFRDRAGQIVTVTQTETSRSVDVFDGTRFHSVVPKAVSDRPSWTWNQMLLQSRGGEWWAGTHDGLCRFAAVSAAGLDRLGPRTCYPGEIFRVFEDSKGGIWASAQYKPGIEDRLMRWDPKTQTVFEFPAPRVPGESSIDMAASFAEDRHGNVWIGLYLGGLYRFDGRRFQLFKQSDGVPRGTIWALEADEHGLWIGSNGGGLAHVENTGEVHPRFEIYNKARGMASDIVLCLAEDLDGRIYAGTGQGVDRLDPRTGNVRHFSSADGLPLGEFTSAARDRSGSLWFATHQGVSRLTPAAERKPVEPRILITDLRVGGDVYPVSQLGEARIAGLQVKPSQNQLQVDFVGLDHEPGDAVRYSYKLEGADSVWSPPRNQHSVNYAALTGGTYRFLVRAITSEGAESVSPAEIDFTVLPPVWRRWWFVSLVTALAGTLVLAAHRYRLAQTVRLERMRMAIATDLHDDIGASLSQIAILSEVARLGSRDGRNGEPLERVANLARELVDSMSDIVWSIRSEPHGMDSLARRMREFALDLLTSQSIDFELRAPDPATQVELSLQARRQLFLMFKECIHNAVRHSRASSVAAELRVTEREVVLTVNDDGVGLNPSEIAPGAAGGTGIAGLRRRAESLGGRMQLTSAPGRGCRVAIHLPTRHGTFAKASL